MAWLKALHITTLLIWCAGLFYLPGLFAAHPRCADASAFRQLRIMTRFTYIVVASPAAVMAILSGTALIYVADVREGWLMLKLAVVSLMVAFHVYCGQLVAKLHRTPAPHPPAAYLTLLIFPSLLIPTVFWLVLGKPL